MRIGEDFEGGIYCTRVHDEEERIMGRKGKRPLKAMSFWEWKARRKVVYDGFSREYSLFNSRGLSF